MGKSALFLLLAVIAFTMSAQVTPKSQLSQIPDGRLSEGMYTNESVGVSYEVPIGWKATADPKTPTSLDWRGPDKTANRCSKILLSLQPASKQEGRYSATAVLFVIDPDCVGLGSFPKTTDELKTITDIATKIGKNYNYTAFMSPFGNQVERFKNQDRVIIRTFGQMTVNRNLMIDGHPPKKKEPLDVSVSISFTEARGCWVAWAYNADQQSEQVLKNVKVKLTN